jgi:hypothetical protein
MTEGEGGPCVYLASNGPAYSGVLSVRNSPGGGGGGDGGEGLGIAGATPNEPQSDSDLAGC